MAVVAMATTAAPTFLPAHRLGGLRLIDGGVWANNPRTTMRYDRGRGSLDRHATYIVATFLAGVSR